MNINIGKWCFNPGLITSLLALIFFCLFISLGLWQLDRAEYKRTLHEGFLKRQNADAINIENIIGVNDYKKYLWRHVIATGNFDEGVQVILDNQVKQGQPGYFVYTPFNISGSKNAWALVNRGWIAAGLDRNKPPELIKTNSAITINAVIKEIPKTGIKLKETEPEKMTEEIYRVDNISLTEIEKLIDKKLLPVIIRLEPDADAAYIREWHIPGSGEEVHEGYAFQWFAFAATLFVIYIVVNTKKLSEEDGTEEKE